MKKLILVLTLSLGTAIGFSQSTFDPNTDHAMSLSQATVMTKAFRDTYPALNIANAFGKTAIVNILNQTGCAGIRFYNAVDSDGNLKLVAVGVNTNGVDMYSGLIAERSFCCTTVKCWPCSSTPLSQ